MAAWSGAFDEFLFEFGFGRGFGSRGQLVEVGWRGGREGCCCCCCCCCCWCGERGREEDGPPPEEGWEQTGKLSDHGVCVCVRERLWLSSVFRPCCCCCCCCGLSIESQFLIGLTGHLSGCGGGAKIAYLCPITAHPTLPLGRQSPSDLQRRTDRGPWPECWFGFPCHGLTLGRDK